MSSDGDPVVCAIFGILFGLGLFWDGLRKYKEKQYILNTPTSKVQSVAVGFAEVAGKAEAAEVGESIVEKKPATYHAWILERWEKRGKHSEWVVVKRGGTPRQFYVNDGTGGLLVNPEGAKVEIPEDYKWEGNYSGAPPLVKKFFEENKISTKGFLFEHKYKFTEWFISPGDPIYAIGTVQDRPGEYAKGHENLVMAENKGPGPKMFYISDRSEKEVLDKYYKWIWPQIAGGIILVGAGLFFTLLRFELI